MFTRSSAINNNDKAVEWSDPIEIGGGCDCTETSITGIDNHLFVAVSGRHIHGASKCSTADVDSGVLDVFFIESETGGNEWSSALWLEHNADDAPRSLPRIGATPKPAEVVWVASLRGVPGQANVSYWSRDGSGSWLSESTAPQSRDITAYMLDVAVPIETLGSGCSALYLASVSVPRAENDVVRISHCAKPERWTFPVWQPVRPNVVASGDFLAVLVLNTNSLLCGWEYVSGRWYDKGVLINTKMPIYPSVDIQQDTSLAIVAPSSIMCPSHLSSWTLLPQTSWTAGGFAGTPSGDLPCINSHSRVAFHGTTPLIGVVFIDDSATIYHNYCTWPPK